MDRVQRWAQAVLRWMIELQMLGGKVMRSRMAAEVMR